jgi:hypothetical protein
VLPDDEQEERWYGIGGTGVACPVGLTSGEA